jgi:hypothetical protein
MMTAKEEVRKLLKRLPDNCTLEEILYHVSVLRRIRSGLADVEWGRMTSQEEVERRMERWLDG